MYEVEVKARLRNREEVIKKLEALGCSLSEELHQVDYIFNAQKSIFPPPLGEPVLRVRKQNDKYILTLKIDQSSRQDCMEHELEISDGEKMKEIIKLLGFREDVTVKKIRVKTMYKDIEISLDSVELLGEFIEAEKMVKEKDPEIRKQIQEELMAFLVELGVLKEDQVIDGKYDIMLFEKMDKNDKQSNL